MKSLEMAARVRKFRVINDGESEDDYRNALADHVFSIDSLESEEIRNKVGWDKFSDKQNRAMLWRQ